MEAFLLLTVGIHAVLLSIGLSKKPEPSKSDESTAVYLHHGMIEADSLKIAGKSGLFSLIPQSTDSFDQGRWSGNQHLFGQTTQEGDSVSFFLTGKGKHRLIVYLTRANDYGIVQFFLNGKTVGAPINLWSIDPLVFSTGPLDLGEVELGAGENQLQLKIVGRDKSNAPPHYQFGFDGIKLVRL